MLLFMVISLSALYRSYLKLKTASHLSFSKATDSATSTNPALIEIEIWLIITKYLKQKMPEILAIKMP